MSHPPRVRMYLDGKQNMCCFHFSFLSTPFLQLKGRGFSQCLSCRVRNNLGVLTPYYTTHHTMPTTKPYNHHTTILYHHHTTILYSTTTIPPPPYHHTYHCTTLPPHSPGCIPTPAFNYWEGTVGCGEVPHYFGWFGEKSHSIFPFSGQCLFS